jgi:hypothetical protein
VSLIDSVSIERPAAALFVEELVDAVVGHRRDSIADP